MKRLILAIVIGLALCAGMFVGAMETSLSGKEPQARAQPVGRGGGSGPGPCSGAQPHCFRDGCINGACPPRDWCTGRDQCVITTYNNGAQTCEMGYYGCSSNPGGGGLGTVIF